MELELVLRRAGNSKLRHGMVLVATAGSDSARARVRAWCAVPATEQKQETVLFPNRRLPPPLRDGVRHPR
jgi:hypothetical protein